MILKTKSFELAVYAKGNKQSPKLALVLPGKLDTKDYAHLTSHVDMLAQDGFYAMSVDPPGTWESSGSIEIYKTSNYLQAVNELIELFGNKPTFVMGHSRGATVSIASGCSNPNIFAFAAVMPSHIRGDYLGKHNEGWEQQGYTLEKRDLPPGGGEKVKAFELPYGFFEDQVSYDFTSDLQSCKKPKLFIYGSHDTAAIPERVKAICDIAHDPKRLYKLDSDHNYRHHPKLISEVNDVIGQFLKSLNH